jgi:outer membrane protein OmpA-like peptidoglycan-associated protein
VRRVLRVAAGFIVLVAGLVVAPVFIGVLPASASTGTVTAPPAPTFSLSTAGQDPGDFVLSGFAGDATLLVSIGFVDPPAGTTFALPTTTGLTAGSGYDFTGNKTQISFTGSQTNANTALAAMTVSTGATNGTVTIRVTASVNATNVYYNPINDHFYEYVSNPANVFAWRTGTDKSLSAFHLAEQRTLNGMTGYLATVTNAQEQRFIYNNFPNSNIWTGGTDDWQVINERCAPSISNKALTSNVATLTTSTRHAIEVADSITIAGVDATFNGTFTVTAATSTTFSYAKTAGDVASGAVGSGASATFANQTSAEGSWLWVSGPTDEKCTRFTQGATGSQKWIVASSGRTQDRLTANVSSSRYENWCNGNGGTGDTAYTLIERNNYGEPNGTGTMSFEGEQFLLEKWNGASCWNDWGRIDNGQNTGFLVEYGGAGSTSNAPSATVSAIVDNAPKNVTASRATPAVSGRLNVSWTAPATGTVTSYTATSTPGSFTCTSATTSCTVTGLTNGTSYTFTVTATFNDTTTKTSTASAAAIPDDGTTPTVTVTTARIRAATSATVRSTKTGTAYLVKDTVTVTNKASITGAADSQWNQVSIAAVNTDTSLAATGLVDGTYKVYAVDAIDNLSTVSTGTVTVDSTAPTSVTIAASSTTSSSATITFTVTGSEDLDCTTLSTTAGTDFTLTGISAISSIAQTSGTVCTITATSTATAGGGAVTSTLTAAVGTFSVSDVAGNAQTTLSGSPQAIVVTVPATATQTAEEVAAARARFLLECAQTNDTHPDCPGRTTTTATTLPGVTTTVPTTTSPSVPTTLPSVTTTTVATRTTNPTSTTVPTSPRVTIPNVETPKRVVVLTSSSAVDPTRLVADAAKDFASEGDVAVAAKMRAALISAAPTIGNAIAEATVRLATVLENKSSTKLEIVKAKAAVADAVSLTILEALKVATGNVTSLALPITKGKELPEVDPGKALIFTSTGNASTQIRIVNETTIVMSSAKENLSLAMSAIDSAGGPAKVSETGSVIAVIGQSLAVTGTGFRSNSPVNVWIFSNPRNFGTVMTDANGSFSAEVLMPDNIAPGNHTVQVNGQNARGGTSSMNMGLEVALEETAVGRSQRATGATNKSVTSRVYFKAQSAILTKTTQKQLTNIVNKFAGASGVSIKCVGYTQLGIRSDRYKLAEDRAKAVCARLKKLGLNADYLAVGMGRAPGRGKLLSGAARQVVITVNSSQGK